MLSERKIRSTWMLCHVFVDKTAESSRCCVIVRVVGSTRYDEGLMGEVV